MLPHIDEAEVTITNNDPTVVTRSRSGRKAGRNLEKQHWQIAVTWPDYLDDKALPIEIALDDMKGQSVSADLIHPVRGYHKSAEGQWIVQSPVNAGSESVQITGTGTLTIGHYLRFDGHSKVYRVRSFEDGVVNIYPQLRSAVLVSEFVITQAVPISVTRTDDDVSYKYSGPLVSLSANFEEML